MTSEEFVERVRIAVYESVTEGTLSLLQKPPGRRPSKILVELSHWFSQVSADEQEWIRATIQLAVRNAVFEMLVVLDGVSSIHEAGEERGALELRYAAEGKSVLLNDPTGEFLHDIFAEYVPPA